ncbi:isoprenylcysteine carboxylmethyltransferase family protein [Pseudoalteromonas luteoviolacea]|uniref:methyltransferase family protein n=1 Tax=Pseudoalteromonas luteoviolacea TaxID=43657 RepID=UPI001F228A68|nr:isoprenylcysteine carboxylmethyltransferase family protein [Pseudoalteromonas luteoviolacea]MCF6438758.1 isoprenylcysteine carboxylmethyltransferase family protein [Pseudoalteromonas luteoviolacea]
MQKLLPPFLYLITLISMALLCWSLDVNHLIVYPYNLVGLPFLIAGLLLAAGAKKLFVHLGTNVMTFSEPGKLVTHGAFKFSRNPMYLGFAVSLLGAALLFGAGIVSLVCWLGFIVITDRWYIRFEERAMRQKFGSEYAQYCCQVRRWI